MVFEDNLGAADLDDSTTQGVAKRRKTEPAAPLVFVCYRISLDLFD
jgi:hypothetical protein